MYLAAPSSKVFITFCFRQKQKFFVSGSWLDTEIDVLSDLRFPCRTILVGLLFFVFSATPGTRNDDGKIVFPAQFITQISDVVTGLFAVVIFVVFDVVSSAKNDVIMNVPFVNMGVTTYEYFPSKSLSVSSFPMRCASSKPTSSGAKACIR